MIDVDRRATPVDVRDHILAVDHARTDEMMSYPCSVHAQNNPCIGMHYHRVTQTYHSDRKPEQDLEERST